MNSPGLTKEDVLSRLRDKQAGRTQQDFAAEIGISRPYLSDVLNGRRDPGPAILNYLGLEPGYIDAEDAA